MHAHMTTHKAEIGGVESRDHRITTNSMIKVMTSKGFDFIKSTMLNHYIKSGYVLALA